MEGYFRGLPISLLSLHASRGELAYRERIAPHCVQPIHVS